MTVKGGVGVRTVKVVVQVYRVLNDDDYLRKLEGVDVPEESGGMLVVWIRRREGSHQRRVLLGKIRDSEMLRVGDRGGVAEPKHAECSACPLGAMTAGCGVLFRRGHRSEGLPGAKILTSEQPEAIGWCRWFPPTLRRSGSGFGPFFVTLCLVLAVSRFEVGAMCRGVIG